MLLDKLDKNTMVQEKALDAAWLRNDVLAHNLANVDTPRYNRKDVDFESYMRNAMRGDLDDLIVHRKHNFKMGSKTDPASVRPAVTEDYNSMTMRIDGNNVDVDAEMAQMAKNTIKYNTVTENINGKFSKIKHVIAEGKR